jgi:hypothetical protein
MRTRCPKNLVQQVADKELYLDTPMGYQRLALDWLDMHKRIEELEEEIENLKNEMYVDLSVGRLKGQ